MKTPSQPFLTKTLTSLRSYGHTLRSFGLEAWLYLTTSAIFGFAIFGGIYTTLLNLYLLRLGYDPEFAGIINGVGQVAFGLCALPAGLLGRRWGSRRMLIAGLSMMALGFGLLPLTEISPLPQTIWLLLMQSIGQIGIAFYFVNGAPFITTVTTPVERNHVFAVSIALLPLAGFAGSLTSGLLPGLFAVPLEATPAQPEPYQISLLLGALLMLPAVLAMTATHTNHRPAALPIHQREPAPVGVMVVLFVGVLLRVVGEGAIRTFLNIYLDDGLGLPVAQIGLLMASGQLLAIPASLLMPLMAARWGLGETYIYSTGVMALGFLPLALVPHWAAAGLGYMVVLTFLSIARPAIIAFQMDAVPADWRTMMGGTTTAAVGGGWALASLSGSFLISYAGYPAMFLSSAAMTLAAGLVFWLYFLRGGRS